MTKILKTLMAAGPLEISQQFTQGWLLLCLHAVQNVPGIDIRGNELGSAIDHFPQQPGAVLVDTSYFAQIDH